MANPQSPLKGNELGFRPREPITTPNKDTPAKAKTVYSHVSKFHNLLVDWIKLHEKGTKLSKTVSALKLHECNDDYYPPQLKQISESLIHIVNGFKDVVEGIEIINNQLKALAQLPPVDEPVISTWIGKQISEHVDQTLQSLNQEYKLKKVVLENICHCRDEKLLEVYVSAWEFDVFLDLDSNAYLFADLGLSMIV